MTLPPPPATRPLYMEDTYLTGHTARGDDPVFFSATARRGSAASLEAMHHAAPRQSLIGSPCPVRFVFDGTDPAVGKHAGCAGWCIVVAATIFHPQGGGQPSDVGHVHVTLRRVDEESEESAGADSDEEDGRGDESLSHSGRGEDNVGFTWSFPVRFVGVTSAGEGHVPFGAPPELRLHVDAPSGAPSPHTHSAAECGDYANHLTARWAAAPPAALTVTQEVDKPRRLRAARLHSAGHLLARVVERLTEGQLQAVRGHHFDDGNAHVLFAGVFDPAAGMIPLDGSSVILDNDPAVGLLADVHNPASPAVHPASFDAGGGGGGAEPFAVVRSAAQFVEAVNHALARLVAMNLAHRHVRLDDGTRAMHIAGLGPPMGCGGTHVKKLGELRRVVLRKVSGDRDPKFSYAVEE